MASLLGVCILLSILAGLFLLGFLAFSVAMQLYRLVRFERSLSLTIREVKPRSKLASFEISNPYATPGRYWKGQLHIHTSEHSRDATMGRSWIIDAYHGKGYDFLVLTDHYHLASTGSSPEGILLIPGTEDAYPWKVLGHHFLRIMATRPVKGSLARRFTQTCEDGGIVALAHPSWRGGLGLGRWLPQDIPECDAPLLVEIFSRYSNSIQENVNLWHYLLNSNQNTRAIWGIASDDLHRRRHLNRGWVMVKSEALTARGIVASLKAGSFYASTGPVADFGLEGKEIAVKTNNEATIAFISSRNRVVAAGYAREMSYTPRGNEGFVRVEVEDDAGGRVWSQPFFLQPLPGPSQGPGAPGP